MQVSRRPPSPTGPFDKWAMATWPGFSDLMIKSHRQSAEKR